MSMGIFEFSFPDESAGQGNVSAFRVSPKAWLYAAITVPLTVVTLLLAYAWVTYTGRKFIQRRK
jgi:hypothetical protein